MSSEIKVTFGALEGAQADVAAAAGRIRTQLEDLKRYLAPMVGTWTGQAAADYQAVQQKWDASAAGLNDTLNRIGVALGQANEAYRRTEQANAARWRA